VNVTLHCVLSAVLSAFVAALLACRGARVRLHLLLCHPFTFNLHFCFRSFFFLEHIVVFRFFLLLCFSPLFFFLSFWYTHRLISCFMYSAFPSSSASFFPLDYNMIGCGYL
jgi:hypothetical protein